jgi:hypothetical protein
MGDLQVLNSLIHRKDQMLYKIVKLLSFYMSDLIFSAFSQKLWNSFDLNESGHVSLSETQRVSSEFRIQIQISQPWFKPRIQKSQNPGAQSLKGRPTKKEHKVYSEKITSWKVCRIVKRILNKQRRPPLYISFHLLRNPLQNGVLETPVLKRLD